MSVSVNDVLTYARNLAQTDSNGLTDTVGLTFINDGLETMTREMVKHNVNAAQITEVPVSVLSGVGVMNFPSDMFALKTISVNYTDSAQQNYIQGQQLDVANIQGQTSPDWLRINQPTQAPLISTGGNTFEIFPTPKTSNPVGVKIIYFKTPTEYNGTTASVIGYPQTLDYRCLSCFVAMMFAKSLRKFDMSQVFEAEFKTRLQALINILAPVSKQPIEAVPIQDNGWTY